MMCRGAAILHREQKGNEVTTSATIETSVLKAALIDSVKKSIVPVIDKADSSRVLLSCKFGRNKLC